MIYIPWLNQLKWQTLLLMHEFKEIRSLYSLTCALNKVPNLILLLSYFNIVTALMFS